MVNLSKIHEFLAFFKHFKTHSFFFYLNTSKNSLPSLCNKCGFGAGLLSGVEVLCNGEGLCLGGEGKLPIRIITCHNS